MLAQMRQLKQETMKKTEADQAAREDYEDHLQETQRKAKKVESEFEKEKALLE